MAEETLFDKILSGEIPSEGVYEDDDVYAFRDINPQAPTHVLVIPRKKLASFVEVKSADPETIGRFMRSVSKVATELGLDDDGYRVVFNSGPDAQQSVAYIHAHILGGRQLGWPPG